MFGTKNTSDHVTLEKTYEGVNEANEGGRRDGKRKTRKKNR